jgi:hypothetical protein
MQSLAPSQTEILQKDIYEDVMEQIFLCWQLPVLSWNPAPNPVSLRRKDLQLLAHQAYMVGEKSDGVRYLLWLSRFSRGSAAGEPFSVMIDRALRIYQVQVTASSLLFEGTLFDGELVRDDRGPLKFICFDLIRHKGRSLLDKDFNVRQQVIALLLPLDCMTSDKNGVSSNDEHMVFCRKQFVDIAFLPTLANQEKHHESDGLVFMPVKEGICHGTQRNFFKFKPLPTIDTLWHEGKHWCVAGGRSVAMDIAFPNVIFDDDDTTGEGAESNSPSEQPREDNEERQDEGHQEQNASKTRVYHPENAILESHVAKENGHIRLRHYRTRYDKCEPNQEATIAEILLEVEEHITYEELCELAAHKNIS